MLKCIKFDYSAPPDPLAGFKGPTCKGRGGEGRGGERKEEGREWEGRKGKGEGGAPLAWRGRGPPNTLRRLCMRFQIFVTLYFCDVAKVAKFVTHIRKIWVSQYAKRNNHRSTSSAVICNISKEWAAQIIVY